MISGFFFFLLMAELKCKTMSVPTGRIGHAIKFLSGVWVMIVELTDMMLQTGVQLPQADHRRGDLTASRNFCDLS